MFERLETILMVPYLIVVGSLWWIAMEISWLIEQRQERKARADA